MPRRRVGGADGAGEMMRAFPVLAHRAVGADRVDGRTLGADFGGGGASSSIGGVHAALQVGTVEHAEHAIPDRPEGGAPVAAPPFVEVDPREQLASNGIQRRHGQPALSDELLALRFEVLVVVDRVAAQCRCDCLRHLVTPRGPRRCTRYVYARMYT